MSPRPMRRYKASVLVCVTCGLPVRLAYRDGHWEHVDRRPIKDLGWHVARIA